jgi:HD superfamily phosphodiesterase
VIAVEEARELARELLADALPRRWSHVQAVARQAERIGDQVVGQGAGTLAAAAWLHDVGYAPAVVDTGFHPLDGRGGCGPSGWTSGSRPWSRITHARG